MIDKDKGPYEIYDGKIGVRIKFLVSDRNRDDRSLDLIKYRALRHRISSKTSPERELCKPATGQEALVEFHSLHREWRDQLILNFGKPKEEIRKSFFEQHYAPDRRAFDFFAKYRYGDNKKLPPEVIETYTYNASVLNTVIAVKAARKHYIKTVGYTGGDIWQSLSNDVNSLDVPHTLPTTRDTLRHKVNRYVKEKYKSVISGKYGSANAAKVKNKHQQAVIEELLGKHQNLNNEQVADIYNTIANSAAWKSISAGTVAKVRRDKDLYVYAGSQGITEFKHKRTMQVKRSGPSVPMAFWSLDGWTAELLYQKKAKNTKGQLVTTYHNRLTMVVVLDAYNNYPIGYAIGENEDPALIRQAIRNAVNHTQELFGHRYKPFQLQSDNYQIKSLRPIYEAMSRHFTPARVGNSKAKPIENWFDKFSEKRFQAALAPNWSGHNVTARPENQPNGEYLDKIKKQFPDEYGCRQQLVAAIEAERAELRSAYLAKWDNVPEEDRLAVSLESYLRWFGETTGYTNRLSGNGLTPTIGGKTYYFDTFDLKFREYFKTDWMVRYDPEDLTDVLVTNAKSRDGKLIEEIGTLEFILSQKHIQPMALYDRKNGDGKALGDVEAFNKQLEKLIIDNSEARARTLMELLHQNPELETLQKLLITDSAGQHKEQRQRAAEMPQMAIPEPDEQYEIVRNIRHNY